MLAVIAGLVWALLPAAPVVARVGAARRGPAGDGLAWLTTKGGRIADEGGRTVLLRGFNSDALLEPAARHAPLDDTDAATMAAAGFDVVRLPISWALLEPQRGVIDRTELDRIAATVAMLNRHGLYVVLDMHVLDWSTRYRGSGAPDWATGPGWLDTGGLPWRLVQTHLNPAQNADTTYFWLSPDWQAEFASVWRAVAGRFRDVSGVAGYDLYNEPHPLPLPPRIFERDYMWPFYGRLISDIATVDSNHLWFVEGIFFGNFGTAVRPLAAPNLVYAPHLYTGSLVPPSFDNADPGPLRARVAEQVSEAAAVPAVLWSGELGIDRAMVNSTAWADAALDAFDDAGAGWAWWQWRESLRWGIRTASGDAVDTAYLRHLARPYLAVSPTGVSAGRGDGVHGHLAVRVHGARTGSVVSVAWAAATLGTPRVAGSCVAPGPVDALRGRLDLTVTAPDCTVEITASGPVG